MMRALLAIDTATDRASVAAVRPGIAPVVVTEQGARRHAAVLLGMIHRALRGADMTLDALSAIAVSDGPGSFTGLRIGWAAAKGLAHERRIPLVTAPSLLASACAAWQALGAQAGAVTAACYDALRGQVFGALYRFEPAALSVVVPPSLLTLAELARVAPVRPRAVTGDGARLYADEVYVWTGRPPLEDTHAVAPAAAALCTLAAIPGALEPVDDPATREPVYGRPAEAQVKWETRHGRPLSHSPRPAR